ncbi:DNA-processing protein DprA [Rhodothermus marinus]|uniref:DNA-processing protein DprA n=1 Tax=Rhodothermus marinus TaxID=29549 RepID=UPI0006D1D9A5|nr:DNA-processing protein DprA [Rhodothermus marinus]
MQEQAKAELATLITKRIRVLTPHDDVWPAGLEALPEHQRPFLLFAYGNLELLAQPTVALLARPPISDAAYDRAQDLTLHLIEAGCVPVTGALSGLDVALQKLCHNAPRPHPAIMVAHTRTVPAPSAHASDSRRHAAGRWVAGLALPHGTATQ